METASSRPSQSPTPFKYAPLLTRDEELAIARHYHATHDPESGRRLVESHLRLVAKIARQCCSRAAMLPDLIQEGCLGLMRAVQKYDPGRGIRLSSYAAWWIRAFIYQHIMTNSRMMKIATTFTQRKVFFNLNRESARLERAGKEALSEDIADALGVPEEAVVEMRARMASRDVQMETTVAVDSGSLQRRLDGVSAPLRPDDLVEGRQLQDAIATRLAQVVATLNLRDRTIFDERLVAEHPATLRQLGLRFGISRERTRQLEERLKRHLRPFFQEFRGDSAGEDQRLAS